MSKKLITACMALVALAAFALPASASASPELGETTGSPLTFDRLVTGVKIKGTNVGNAKFVNSSLGVISECSKVVLTGELTKNTGTSIEGTVSTATFEGSGSTFNGMKECVGESALGSLTPTTNGKNVDNENVENGTPWCVRANNEMAADEFQVRGGACNEAARKITFILDTTLAGECKYERTAAIKGTYTTDVSGQDAVLTVKSGTTSEFTRESGGFFCPTTGSLEMSFTMETDTKEGEPVVPLYIK